MDGLQRKLPAIKTVLVADPPRQLGIREAGDAFRSQAASAALAGKTVSALMTRPGNSGFGRQGMLFAAKRLLLLWQGRPFLPCRPAPTTRGSGGRGCFRSQATSAALAGKVALPCRPAPTSRGSGCSENEAQPRGSPHATVANDVKSPCRFSGRVKGAVRCTSSK